MIDLGWLQLIASSFSTLSLVGLVGLLIAGLVVTRRQYESMRQLFQEEHARTQAARVAEYERMDREYARMVVAKDDAIDRATTQVGEWRAIALQALTGLETTGQQAARAVGAVAAQLPPAERDRARGD